MAEYFEPSPRSSKRRKTARYSAGRTTLEDKDVSSPIRQQHAIGRKSTTRRLPESHNEDGVLKDTEDSNAVIQGERNSGAVSKNAEEDVDMDSRGEVLLDEDLETPVRSTKGRRKAGTGVSPRGGDRAVPNIAVQAENPTSPTLVTASEDEETLEDTISVQPRSSGRERRRPRRFSISPEKPKPKKPELGGKNMYDGEPDSTRKSGLVTTPRGILTPSRRGKQGPRKSVIFDQNDKDIEEQFGFKDIDRSAKKVTSATKKQIDPLPREVFSASKKDLRQSPGRSSSKAAREIVPDDEIVIEEDGDHEDLMIESLIESYEPQATVILPEDVITEKASTVSDDPAITSIKTSILSRLTSSSTFSVSSLTHTAPISRLQSQYQTLHSLLHATITTGESNSLLLLGARGSGKTYLLSTALRDLTAEYSADFHTIRLNGFFQTDDKLALREIWRQLGREMNVAEDETEEVSGSYADTMASLLSLLSHPDELIDPANGNDIDVDNFNGQRSSKSIVFILDEFDLFTTHPRQTLLYNLFDIAQSRKAPIAIIGCSTRMDVVDCLEKRVKSRFSHRWIHVPTVKNLETFEAIVQEVLCISDLDHDSQTASDHDNSGYLEKQWCSQWNEVIKTTFLPSSAIQSLIKQTFYTTKSLPDLFAALYHPIATLQIPLKLIPKESQSNFDLTTQYQINAPSILNLLPTLPTLHLSLLISASRLSTIHSLPSLNFNLVYAHYEELISRSKLRQMAGGAVAVGSGMKLWSRELATSAWEDLGMWGVVTSTTGRDGMGDFGGSAGETMGTGMWRVDVALEEIAWAVGEKWRDGGGVMDGLGKWCREV